MFNDVFDKAELVKSKVNGKSLVQAGRVSADKLIYDRALEKVGPPFSGILFCLKEICFLREGVFCWVVEGRGRA
jgi:hypothetical protein